MFSETGVVSVAISNDGVFDNFCVTVCVVDDRSTFMVSTLFCTVRLKDPVPVVEGIVRLSAIVVIVFVCPEHQRKRV